MRSHNKIDERAAVTLFAERINIVRLKSHALFRIPALSQPSPFMQLWGFLQLC